MFNRSKALKPKGWMTTFFPPNSIGKNEPWKKQTMQEEVSWCITLGSLNKTSILSKTKDIIIALESLSCNVRDKDVSS